MHDNDQLITYTNPKSPISEAYRVLRTNIQFSSVDNPLKAIVVTSAGPGEGKTTTVANIAITFAQSGSRTLLVDCDLRKPKLHKVFGLSNELGITTILAKRESYNKHVQKSPIENLHILTSGPVPPNPSELLSSNSMRQLLESLREEYDIMLIDSPPVGTVTDAAILSTLVDGTILVAYSGHVEIEALQRARDLLDKVNANIIGVVLNRLAKNAQGNYYYYYYYYYSEDEEQPEKRRRNKKRHNKRHNKE